MGIFSGILVYVVLWWITLFAILPLWVTQTQSAVGGNEPGAPQNAFMKRKILITSAIAFICWLGVYAVIEADIEWLNDLFMKMEYL